MCSVAGIIAPEHRTAKLEEVALRMRDSLKHHGPDDEGLYIADGIALAHTRLSIIDLVGGQQPLKNEDCTIYSVVNCEIYNYKNLQNLLERRF